MPTEFTIIEYALGKPPVTRHTRKRDIAGLWARRAIYDMLGANGTRDSLHAWNLMSQAYEWETNYNPRGKTDGKMIFRVGPSGAHGIIYLDWRRL